MYAYQDLESNKYFDQSVETKFRRELRLRRIVGGFCTAIGFMILAFAAGIMFLQYSGIDVADVFHATVNQINGWFA